jgi:hypothetical protein
MRKLATILVLMVVTFFVIMIGDWYRFVQYAELDPKRGVYGNDHLEVWIGINNYMPAPIRAWGCEKLLRREAAVIGATYEQVLPRAPMGCNPERDSMPFDEVVFAGIAYNADNAAGLKGASAQQKADIRACVLSALKTAITPAQLQAMQSGTDGTGNAAITVSQIGLAVSTDCIAKAGL